jgi:hypothetical protein
MPRVTALAFALLLPFSLAHADGEPWNPRRDCAIAKRSQDGLVPQALQALVTIGVEHRITQTINPSSAAANYHGRDLSVDGKDVTAAVDISVRCLDVDAIRRLLSELAANGFAAWYREDGRDGWRGNAHIHAVWAAEPLKRQLRAQVSSWLAGRTGLVGDARYEFWQPTDQLRATVSAKYEASKNRVQPQSGGSGLTDRSSGPPPASAEPIR